MQMLKDTVTKQTQQLHDKVRREDQIYAEYLGLARNSLVQPYLPKKQVFSAILKYMLPELFLVDTLVL
jgi:hypothetical protein